MAPEQIEGGDVDARTDIFAFGALLFEMLTGRPAFQGKTQASLFGAILKDEPPPISQLQPVAPPALDYLVRTCLAKDPDARFQSVHDVRLQLKWIAEGGSGVAAPVVAPRKSRRYALWLAAAIALAAVAGAVGWRAKIPAPDDRVVTRFQYPARGRSHLRTHGPARRRRFTGRDEARLQHPAAPLSACHESDGGGAGSGNERRSDGAAPFTGWSVARLFCARRPNAEEDRHCRRQPDDACRRCRQHRTAPAGTTGRSSSR